jgi:WD40 repeat protein
MESIHEHMPSVAVTAIQKIAIGEEVFRVHCLQSITVFVLGEQLLFVAEDGREARLQVHTGAILASASDSGRILTGGDDGRVVATSSEGLCDTISEHPSRRWIEHVVVDSSNRIGWTAGQNAYVLDGDGHQYELTLESAASGLALVGAERVIVTQNNGVTLWQPANLSTGRTFKVRGSHSMPTVSPDGSLFATSAYEPIVNLWRISDMTFMPLSGYSQRVRCLDWTRDSAWLATGGSERLFLWTAPARDGSMYSVPFLLAPHRAKVSSLACHPTAPIVALGYEDGLVLLVRINDGAEIILSKPGGCPVSAIAWNANAAMVAYACTDGTARIIRFGA